MSKRDKSKEAMVASVLTNTRCGFPELKDSAENHKTRDPQSPIQKERGTTIHVVPRLS
jgi:hypothetical protein